MEKRVCKNCTKEFQIEPEDFAFYEKVKVPPPTWCPECRMMRRLAWRNERTLYKRKCDKTQKDIISVFSPESPHIVYDYHYWYSDDFDPMAYAREYDSSRPFFDQFQELHRAMPMPSLQVRASENCEYNNDMSLSKNCYLCFRTHSSRDMSYVYRGNLSSDCVDCMQVVKSSEGLYECVECISCRDSSYLFFSENCANSRFLWNCRNCLECFMCSNLRNKQYCYKNEQLSKQDYAAKIAGYNLCSHASRTRALREFEEFNKKTIRKNLNIVNSVNVRGDNIVNCKNSYMCFGVKYTENVRYLWDIQKYKDAMDAYSGGRDSELVYECTAGAGASNVRFSVRAPDCRNIEYSITVDASHDIFGCIGLRKKEYCILNKQYAREDYFAEVAKIKDQMTKDGEYGEFFPISMSPFAYNETVAQEYFPLSAEAAAKAGLAWREPETKTHQPTLLHDELPDNIREVSDTIIKEVVGCAHEGTCAHGCTRAFRIVPAELDFYRRKGIALPRQCPNCRHYARLARLNPPKLWQRVCAKCQKEMESSHAPDRPEIVYCEQCYNAEVV